MKLWIRTAASCLAASQLCAATFEEDFATDPGARGWRVFGETELFHWDSAAERLEVTWDSSRPNSYFYWPLGTILTKNDDAQISFELRLDEIAVGVSPGKPFTFELAVGLLNHRDATATHFLRGTATQSPNLMELDYFADSGFGATISSVIVSSNNQFVPSFTAFELTENDVFRMEMRYTATNQTLSTSIQRNGGPVITARDVKLGPSFTDFRLDTLAISSYSDAGSDGSILARGSIDNVALVFPAPPRTELRGTLVDSVWQVTFAGKTGWRYTLERTDDWQEWRAVSSIAPDQDGEQQVLRDEMPVQEAARAFYRVRLERP